MRYLFGPVFSRRLGVSLGVNLFEANICSYDCVYCECGRTQDLTIKRDDYVSLEDVLREVDEYLSIHCLEVDYVTFSGSGEPTLYKDIDKVLKRIRNYPVATALLTNSSLFFDDKVRSDILDFDVIMPTLSTVSETEFQKIHQPHENLKLNEIVENLRVFSQQYKGRLIPEIMLLKGVNDSKGSLERLAEFINTLEYDWCYLNTIVRPPAYPKYSGIDHKDISRIKVFLEKTGVRCVLSKKKIKRSGIPYSDGCILNTLKVRPIKKDDIKRIFSDPDNALDSIERLKKENKIGFDGDFLYLL